jgi:hypothetical protein
VEALFDLHERLVEHLESLRVDGDDFIVRLTFHVVCKGIGELRPAPYVHLVKRLEVSR